eukprot:CAMPEP_0114228062 /NCGR_PEP_ID=MMETSP0058-20121206/2137_1 /TAXON_ID=36894 /ORGANISM="Pyramimonas parkeae, CCMP726" /LENGTH=45 /DNA_ID= /DNA_START= /DNA_END= /DNA_ORIENTATION=
MLTALIPSRNGSRRRLSTPLKSKLHDTNVGGEGGGGGDGGGGEGG